MCRRGDGGGGRRLGIECSVLSAQCSVLGQRRVKGVAAKERREREGKNNKD